MKKISVSIGICLWLIFLCFSIFAQDFKTVSDGIEYAEIKRGTETEPVKINLLRLDLTKVRLDVVHALDAAIGLETTSSMAARYGAFAAINAGFFRLDKSIFAGDATGVLMVDGKLLSESYANRTAMLVTNKLNQTIVNFGQVETKHKFRLKNKYFEANGINRERGDNDIIIFTPEFHQSTLTDSNGTEIIVVKDRVQKIVEGKGSNRIPFNGFVISVGKKRTAEILSKLYIGNKLTSLSIIKTSISKILPYDFSDLTASNEDITGGVPQLINNSEIKITWEQEKSSKSFVETRHPRTAVAKLRDGKFLMATIDGRQKESVGMNLNELAVLLIELGATDAMNLDGGGSTTMFLDGKIVNKPSDKEGERKVSDAILVFPRK